MCVFFLQKNLKKKLLAAHSGDTRIIYRLLDDGANVKHQSKDGKTGSIVLFHRLFYCCSKKPKSQQKSYQKKTKNIVFL